MGFIPYELGLGGSGDDYYYIDDLTPGGHDYNSSHKIIVGIKPDVYTIYNTLTAANSPYIFFKDLHVPSDQTLTIEPE